ncbi:hypothetical protein BDV34DRAFT_207264 [Aspergillus parasiticus]|uniref:Uncharacterized protein n=1 Tax=Aspergillus parasiticus TaxID=5067 RepID=A0A5N6D214_ASPPA|nr:hypothetical protein BDV34DRAFT_207264 [Aspergillus parasiticus]
MRYLVIHCFRDRFSLATYIFLLWIFARDSGHSIPDSIHTKYLGVCKHMLVDDSRIRHNLRNVLANIRYISQGKFLFPSSTIR